MNHPTLAEYGFLAHGDFPQGFAEQVADSAQRISEAMGLEPIMVGSGIRLSLNETSEISVDEIANIIDLKLQAPFSKSSFAYLWAIALHEYNFIERYEEAVTELKYATISPEQFNERVTMRWRHAELGIQNALESVFSKTPNRDKATVAIRAFSGTLESALVISTEATAHAIRRLEINAESLGCELCAETRTLLAMLTAMRANCMREIQEMSALHDNSIKAKLAYFSRMDDLADAFSDDSISAAAPAIAIASFVAQELGVRFDQGDMRLRPTEHEISEICTRIPAFASEMVRKQNSLFDAERSAPAPQFKNR